MSTTVVFTVRKMNIWKFDLICLMQMLKNIETFWGLNKLICSELTCNSTSLHKI